jgi:hypothetical protein
MEIQQDFKELLELLNAHEVEFVIVGAYALAFHGVPRFTGDIDILVKPEPFNAGKILAALKEFGFGSLDLKESDFNEPNKVIQLGVAPVRIDLITSLTGVSWQQVNSAKVKGSYGDVKVYYLGRKELISNKKALGRKKDLADIEALGEN